jgi:hypothetical protein
MLEEKAPIVNKDLLLPSYNSREGGKKILIFATIDLELEEGLMGTRKKKCLNLNFTRGFSGAIKDGM